MKKDGTFNNMIKPILILFIICLVVAVLLGFVNNVTEPIIEENARIKAEETRAAVLEGSNGFTEIVCDAEGLGIINAYKEDNGLGYVLTAGYKGYGGDVVVTIGLNPDGEIVGMSVNTSTETSGIGTKASQDEYVNKFIGLSGDSSSVDTITSATYSSKAVKSGVDAVLAAFAEIGG